MGWVVGQVAGLEALNDYTQTTDEMDEMGGDRGIGRRQVTGAFNTMGGTAWEHRFGLGFFDSCLD